MLEVIGKKEKSHDPNYQVYNNRCTMLLNEDILKIPKRTEMKHKRF